ncbi:MAG: diadenylate cyclase CdaA [Clostridia bacterium]|nr:diadenylate cyclase CdaA [Clostridia bacterium]
MAKIWESLVNGLMRFDLIDALDIALVAVLIYYTLKLVSKTRAFQVLRGIGLVLVITLLAKVLRLQAVSWILNYIISVGAVALVILFQPELRRVLEHFGRRNLLEPLSSRAANDTDRPAMEQLIRAILSMAKKRMGALIVVQRVVAFDEVIETGTVLNAEVSAPLIETLFFEGSALHDGAVVIQGDMVRAAGCFLPLTDRQDLERTLGTRHRAAVGMSEVSDALIIVVSEETGSISAAEDGALRRNLDAASLRKLLFNETEKGDGAGTMNNIRQRLRGLRKRKDG